MGRSRKVKGLLLITYLVIMYYIRNEMTPVEVFLRSVF